MKQISSKFTPLLKYFIPWSTIIVLAVGIIVAFANGQLGLGFALFIVGIVVVGFMRTMLMDLRNVFLDKESKQLIVKGSTDELIPYTDIVEILRPWTPPYIATVRLVRDYSFGKVFTFLPEGGPVFSEDYGEELRSKIRK